MKYFVVADIHGYYTYYLEALNKQGFDINNPNHKLIICGDLFDRGREPKALIEFILNDPNKFILIRGNHEDLLEDMLVRGYPNGADYYNGTFQTLIDLGYNEDISLKEVAKRSGLTKILDLCVNYFETKHYVFVHSWLPTKLVDDQIVYDPNWRQADYYGWLRSKWLNSVEIYQNKIFKPNKTIVSGHWHVNAFHALYDQDKEKG